MKTKAIIKSIPKKLNQGQASLFRLILIKYKKDEQLTAKEIFQIYNRKVQKNTYYWDYRYTGNHGDQDRKREWFRVRYNKETLVQYTNQWFIRTLGTLITKGYVKILPRFDLDFNKLIK